LPAAPVNPRKEDQPAPLGDLGAYLFNADASESRRRHNRRRSEAEAMIIAGIMPLSALYK